MHEYSVVSALLVECEKQAALNDCQNILEVHLKIGIFSGIEKQLLTVAFDTFKEDSMAKEAKLFTQDGAALCKCHSCGSEQELLSQVYTCPKCDSADIVLQGGDELLLMSLKLAE